MHWKAQLGLTGSKKDQEKNINSKNGKPHFFVYDSILPDAVSWVLTQSSAGSVYLPGLLSSTLQFPYLALQHRIFIGNGDTGKTASTEKGFVLKKSLANGSKYY